MKPPAGGPKCAPSALWAKAASLSSPGHAVAQAGPKAMLVNGGSGSGGDCLPWMFRRAGLGPVIGQRT